MQSDLPETLLHALLLVVALPALRGGPVPTIVIVIPAHDEAVAIAATVASAHATMPDGARLLVVADNCSDATARLARNAGAEVLERNDALRRGKGYALRHAFEASRQSGRADAVVVIDADAEVSANLLEACASRIEAGASAVQVHYGVLNALSSWRSR